MPQKASVLVNKGGYTQLTVTDAPVLTLQVIGPGSIYLQGLIGEGTPDDVGAFVYTPTSGERKIALADLFPDIPTANRLYARAVSVDSVVVIRHA